MVKQIFFEILTGLLQGDTLAPHLFAIVQDYVKQQVYDGRDCVYIVREAAYPAITVTDLEFADDLALLTEEIHQAQEILHQLENKAKNVGLISTVTKPNCRHSIRTNK